jgi:hypothetical protein
MIDRMAALNAIKASITTARTTIGLKTFKWAAEDPSIDPDELCCVFLGVGADEIKKRSNRGHLGYPAAREAHIVIELVVNTGDPIEIMFQALRKAVLTNYQISDTSMIREIKSIGPIGYNVPGVKGASLILGLDYIDSGF